MSSPFPFQSGCSQCQASQDYSQLMKGGAMKKKRAVHKKKSAKTAKKASKKSMKKHGGAKKKVMKKTAKKAVKKTMKKKHGGADEDVIINNIGTTWASAMGGRRRRHRGGSETEGATGMPPNWYNAGSSYPPSGSLFAPTSAYGPVVEQSFPNTNLAPFPGATNEQTGGDIPDMSGRIKSALSSLDNGIKSFADRVSSFKLGGGKKKSGKKVAKKSGKKVAKKSGKKVAKKSAKKSHKKMRGGGASDWVGTLYSRGAVNTNTPNDKALFSQFADASEYLSKYDLLHPDTSLATGDNMKDVRPYDGVWNGYDAVGGAKKKSKKSAKKSAKKTAKKSAKKSHKKRRGGGLLDSTTDLLLPTGAAAAAATLGLWGLKKYTEGRKKSSKKSGRKGTKGKKAKRTSRKNMNK
jgi:hypothetical protein